MDSRFRPSKVRAIERGRDTVMLGVAGVEEGSVSNSDVLC